MLKKIRYFKQFFVNVASQLKGPIQMSDFHKLEVHVDSNIHPNTYFNIFEINLDFVRNIL